jgi:hypothetical protein
VLEPFLGKSRYVQHGQRVVEGQRMIQAARDIMLGWERIETIDGETRDFYIRQLWNSKGSAEVDLMDPPALEAYGRVCGWTLARAHARTGDRIAIAAYVGGGKAFDRAMTSFAEAYADQNERDYRALQEAVGSGRVAAELDVCRPQRRAPRSRRAETRRHGSRPSRGRLRRPTACGRAAYRLSSPVASPEA